MVASLNIVVKRHCLFHYSNTDEKSVNWGEVELWTWQEPHRNLTVEGATKCFKPFVGESWPFKLSEMKFAVQIIRNEVGRSHYLKGCWPSLRYRWIYISFANSRSLLFYLIFFSFSSGAYSRLCRVSRGITIPEECVYCNEGKLIENRVSQQQFWTEFIYFSDRVIKTFSWK